MVWQEQKVFSGNSPEMTPDMIERRLFHILFNYLVLRVKTVVDIHR